MYLLAWEETYSQGRAWSGTRRRRRKELTFLSSYVLGRDHTVPFRRLLNPMYPGVDNSVTMMQAKQGTSGFHIC